MKHQDYRITILDQDSNPIGSKLRKDIDSVRDIVHVADVFVVQGKKLLLSRIPSLGLYPGRWSVSAMTMVREGEQVLTAAKRCLEKELGIVRGEVEILGEKFFRYSGGVQRHRTSFLCVCDEAISPNPDDVVEICFLSRHEIEKLLLSRRLDFSPTFFSLWDEY